MKEMNLEAKLENIPVVTGFIEEQLEALDCPMKTMMQMDVAIDEVFTNIASYAYGAQQGDATVRFDFDEENRVASVTFIDSGMPFNPLESAEPDVTLSVEERPVGGLGIFLVKKTMDEVIYVYENGQNVLTIRKKI